MSLTLGEVRASVREHIDEPSPNYWTDAELNDYIQKAQLRLWRKVYALQKDYWLSPTGFILTLQPGVFRYTTAVGNIPTDIFRITAIRTLTSGYQDIDWVPADPNSEAFTEGLRTDSPVQYPYRVLYALRNMGELWVSPSPQINVQAQVDYIQLPTEVELDTDTFLIPDAWLYYVEHQASYMALLKGPLGDPGSQLGQANAAWEEIMTGLDSLRSDQGPDLVIGAFSNDDLVF